MGILEPREIEDQISALIRRELRRLRPAEEDNLFQEVWSSLLSRWPRLVRAYDQQRGAWDAWMSRCIRNILIDCVRRSRRERRICSLLDLHRDLVDDHREPAADGKDHACLAALIEAALNEVGSRIAPRNFELLRMYVIDRQAPEAIAERVGMTPDRVRKHIERMMGKLRGHLSRLLQPDTLNEIRSLPHRKRGGGETSLKTYLV